MNTLETLEQRHIAKLQKILDAAMTEPDDDAPVPDDLAAQIRTRITGKVEPWDAALWDIVREQEDPATEPED